MMTPRVFFFVCYFIARTGCWHFLPSTTHHVKGTLLLQCIPSTLVRGRRLFPRVSTELLLLWHEKNSLCGGLELAKSTVPGGYSVEAGRIRICIDTTQQVLGGWVRQCFTLCITLRH